MLAGKAYGDSRYVGSPQEVESLKCALFELTFNWLSRGYKVGEIVEEESVNIHQHSRLSIRLHATKYLLRGVSTFEQLEKKEHIGQ